MDLEFYQSLHEMSRDKIGILKRKYSRYSLYRGITVLLIIAFLVGGYRMHAYWSYALGAVGVALFIFLVKRHVSIEKEQKYVLSLNEVSGEYMARFGTEWKEFKEDGREYITDEFPQARDLDLFGKNSLYQYICAANTQYGCDCLASWLAGGPGGQDVQGRQKAVSELAGKKDLAVKLQSLARTMKKERKPSGDDGIHSFLETVQKEAAESSLMKVLMWAIPVVTWCFIAAAVLDINRGISLSACLGFACAQFLLVLIGYPKNSMVLRPLYRFSKNIGAYKEIFSLIEGETFNSDYLKELQGRIRDNGGAAEGLGKLARVCDAAAVRYNGLAFILCGALFMWDYHCVRKLVGWSNHYRHNIERWLRAVGELEALMSLTVLCNVKDAYSFPNIHDEGQPSISFGNLKHPLIEEGQAVGNDFSLEHRTCIITGSNMSGKTTFLRSIGINLILAYAGGPVLADHFQASKMTVLTSMRIEDSVSEGISTFYAELLRIKSMIDFRSKGLPMISLIDEIYKGTNSKDRIIGAKETIKRLAGSQSLTMVTTHDFELCEMEGDEDVAAVNFHFSERYTEDEIIFDYKIKAGRCRTTNAQHLLRMVGIL